MNAEIISIGTELLLGDIVNTNSAFLARELAALGINVFHQSVVGDNADRLKGSLELALLGADIVMTTGGLGPLMMTSPNKPLLRCSDLNSERHADSVKRIETFFAHRGIVMTPNNLLQADVPCGATVFQNGTGSAPGMAVCHQGKYIIMLPGPPSEMEPMFIRHVSPFLQQKRILSSAPKRFIFSIWENRLWRTGCVL